MTAPNTLPLAIQQMLWKEPERPHNLAELSADWAEHVARVRREAPYAIIEEDGETVYTGALSPGCQACKAGTWDCLFLTPHCNLNCSFCCSPSLKHSSVPLSALGEQEDEVIANLSCAQPDGISFSGGEAFLDFPRLCALVSRIRDEFPRAYLWAYTNGLLATAAQLDELAHLGLDEIRFNMAASGYTHPGVLSVVENAARSLPAVTVEIPAIPRDATRLLGALEAWSQAGVRFLNLHELMYEPGSLSADLPGPRRLVRTPDGHTTEIHPGSRQLTFQVMQAVQALGLPLAVNDCSMQNKLRQVRGRRKFMARLVERRAGAYEQVGADGCLHALCAFDEDGENVFLHPGRLEEAKAEYPGFRFIELRRVPPLTVFEQARWEFVKECE
jgi:pyruvate formate-lyase activating enzyme-like uncharacterized protein